VKVKLEIKECKTSQIKPSLQTGSTLQIPKEIISAGMKGNPHLI